MSWWRHQKETSSALLALCAGNSPVTGAWINDWVNNLEAGDLRRHHANYYVTVMCSDLIINHNENNFPSNLNYQRSTISTMVPRLCNSLETLAIHSCINHSVVSDMNIWRWVEGRNIKPALWVLWWARSFVCFSGDSHTAVSELQWHCETWHDDVLIWGCFPHHWTFVGECTD